MIGEIDIGDDDDSIKLIRNGSYVIKQTKKLTIDNFIAMSGEPYKVSYIEQGTTLTCQCGYTWIEHRFTESAICPRCDARKMERDRRNLVQSSTSAKQSQLDEILNLLNFGSIDPIVIE